MLFSVVGHPQSNGFRIEKEDVTGKQLGDVKMEYNVPEKLIRVIPRWFKAM